ncbi:rhodanese-like domain-containing protein [Flammeovirga yaeyamensis]|uniref:Rhodanese-like domain-containing protein n=1 Tax=Flammeovirga yaeyamensis TaxID=367791 RepID=A0AAX1N766_9BACT|nr:rhodanese-like domain-containing protein [Flammeovirga yaeyamensis]MBB3697943.1 rhodanese-related sulfurtransferase [Flammeovirga yaeyamensis]NMF35702.1 rhodanese-like domain-containing protein [Flammeovirga yaeyamensis]QWG03345.1 rhodanese-like domain-containing protein [Flammeovirga yaeyamensis]
MVSCESATTSNEPQVSVSEFAEIKNTHPNAIIIDVRTPGEYEQGTMENAQNINVKSNSFKEEVKDLDKEATVMVFCKGGVRSAKAKSILKEMGFENVVDLEGGFDAWKSGGGKVVHQE